MTTASPTADSLREQAIDYLAGRLSSEAAARFESRLSEPEVAEAVSDVVLLRAACETFSATTTCQIRQSSATAPSPSRQRLAWVIATSVACLFGLVGLQRFEQAPSGSTAEVIAAERSLTVEAVELVPVWMQLSVDDDAAIATQVSDSEERLLLELNDDLEPADTGAEIPDWMWTAMGPSDFSPVLPEDVL